MIRQQQKLERWAHKELERNIHTMIIDNDHGGYLLFGRYYVAPMANHFNVYNLNDQLLGSFSDKRTAVSWCVAEKHRQLNLANEIASLDRQKQNITADISLRKKLAERSKAKSFGETVLIKLQSKMHHQQMLTQQLEKCINLAKYLQIKGFQNETARTGNN
jgi:hypothetical protein